MSTATLSVTDFSRGISDYLSRVQYRGELLDIVRGKRVIARVVPAEESQNHSDGFPIDEIDAFLATGAQLDPDDGAAFFEDLNAIRKQVKSRRDPWA